MCNQLFLDVNELILLLFRFEEIGSSNGQDEEEEEDDNQPSESDGVCPIRHEKRKHHENMYEKKTLYSIVLILFF